MIKIKETTKATCVADMLRYVEYRKFVNLAYMSAVCADYFALQAEDILRQESLFTLENKHLFNFVKKRLLEIVNRANKIKDDNLNDAFFDSSTFLKHVIELLSDINDDKQDEILTFIKTMQTC